jgi:hypothetical protein
MKRIISIVSLFILGAVPASSYANVKSASDDEKALIQLESRIADATLRRDIKFLDGVYANGLVRTASHLGEMNKEESLMRVKSNTDKIESITVSGMVVRVFGETAIVTGRTTVRGRNPDNDVNQHYQHLDRFTDTFVKRQGSWQLVAAHASIIVTYGIHEDISLYSNGHENK